MQLYSVLSLALAGVTVAKPCYNSSEPAGHNWWPAQLGDSRSPCPMLNSLANHAFLPRNGKNLDQSAIASALNGALNFPVEPFLSQIQGGLAHSSTGKNGTFNLEDLVHKPMEHDGSLSRNDAFWGDALHFDPLIWAKTAQHFIGKDVISIETAAKARTDRMAAAEALNPDFTLTETQMTTSYAESGLYLLTFGNKVTGDAKTEWVKIMFEQERLPYAEGWRKANVTISAADIGDMVKKIMAVGA